MKSPRIEAKPKTVKVVLLQNGKLPINPNTIDGQLFAQRLNLIYQLIRHGKALPEWMYRQTEGRDTMLESRGWLHLHIGYGIDNDILLIVEQTPDTVIFIGLTNHSIFKEKPAGKRFYGLGSKIQALKMTKIDPDGK